MGADAIDPVTNGVTDGSRVAVELSRAVPHAAIWDRIERSALLIAVFLSGWSVLRVGSINLTFSDVAFLSCFVIFTMRGRLNLWPFGPLTPYWMAGLTMMLGGLFVSSVVNGDPMRWANVALQYTVALLFIPVLLMQQDRRMTAMMPVAFVLGIALSEMIGISATFAFTLHDTERLLGDGFITGNGRLGSMAGQPNPNGAVISFALPMLIYARRKGTISLPVALICGGALLWGLMLSASFTGFFASVVAIVVTLAVIGLRHLVRLGVVVTIALSLFVASGAPLPKTFQQRVGGAVESGDMSQAGTFLNRADLITEAWRFAENNTVIGMGVDRYREISHYDNPVHNLYLLIWNEGGAVAFIGLIVMLALLIVLAAGGLRRSRDEGAMACAVVIVFLIYTVSYPHMYSRMWIMPIMVALATIYAQRNSYAFIPQGRGAADPEPDRPSTA